MKYTINIFIASLICLSVFFLIVFMDLQAVFSYSDIPFFLAVCIYSVFIFFQRSSSKFSFVMTAFFIFYMGISYLQNGFDTMTERIGEWYYIFFGIGLLHYANELKHNGL